jgi:hypothetical protein
MFACQSYLILLKSLLTFRGSYLISLEILSNGDGGRNRFLITILDLMMLSYKLDPVAFTGHFQYQSALLYVCSQVMCGTWSLVILTGHNKALKCFCHNLKCPKALFTCCGSQTLTPKYAITVIRTIQLCKERQGKLTKKPQPLYPSTPLPSVVCDPGLGASLQISCLLEVW